MITEFLLAGLGLLILLLAGDILVRGAVNLSLRLGIPALIVSLTVVAFGTSAPELLISIQAIWEHVPGLALGNVVGSNTANILLVLGVPALISGLDTRKCESRRTYLMMIAGTFLFIGLASAGPFTWWHGLILLTGLGLVLTDQFCDAQSHRAAANCISEEDALEEADPSMPDWKVGLYLLLGLIGLPLGASLLVESSTAIARAYGITETVIGLTLVAVGTSLPELATTVMAAIRKHADVALGNVIGSNMFNLLAIIGVSSLVGPIPVDSAFFTFDFWVMLGASLLLAPFVFLKLQMGRAIGMAFVALYVIYIAILLI
ncbi:calcium/sodium antiporter [Rhodophyticola sp. CCM32]|uniref:calcium/sodium antiporter n=1 Tax=Rhodophyticola sp. CCM32 TaxID=2916397 RepID=UPI00107FC130|nr:calcium/sodium antiporter [Rhodophyticola sp. CCM32]QBY02492.1 calcium/sodium antiporter [Rhodophyticola sp. CCM32]